MSPPERSHAIVGTVNALRSIGKQVGDGASAAPARSAIGAWGETMLMNGRTLRRRPVSDNLFINPSRNGFLAQGIETMPSWTKKLLSAVRGLLRGRGKARGTAKVRIARRWRPSRISLRRALSCASVLAVLIKDQKHDRWLPRAFNLSRPQSSSFDDLCTL